MNKCLLASGGCDEATVDIFPFFLPIHPIFLVCQEEIAEIKRKMKTMNNQVARLRDEISGKELALAKDEQEHKRLDKDNEALKVPPSVSEAKYLT